MATIDVDQSPFEDDQPCDVTPELAPLDALQLLANLLTDGFANEVSSFELIEDVRHILYRAGFVVAVYDGRVE